MFQDAGDISIRFGQHMQKICHLSSDILQKNASSCMQIIEAGRTVVNTKKDDKYSQLNLFGYINI